MIIAFCGIDGSGKSSIANELFIEMKNAKKKVKLVHIDKYFVFEPLVRLIRLVINNKNSTQAERNKALGTTKKPLILKLWVIISILDNLIRFFYFLILRFFGYVIICDRYFYDKIAGFIYHGYAGDILYRYYLKFTPKPTVCFKLTLSSTLAMNRETGDIHSLDFFTTLTGIYAAVFKTICYIDLDSTKSIKENLFIVRKSI